MKRSQIKITLVDRTKECNRELRMRLTVYERKIQQKELSEYEANKRIVIIQEYKELVAMLSERGLSWEDLINHIAFIKRRPVVRQAKMDFRGSG